MKIDNASPTQLALNDLTKRRMTADNIRQLHGNQMFEGLISKGYANVVQANGMEFVEITVPGVKALLDFEGISYGGSSSL